MNKNDWISIRYGLRHTGYRLFENSPRCVAVGQRGAILPLVAIGMGALLAMAGLALDMGHGYVNKTRLQNALDAAALSGAKTLDETTDTGKATTAAKTAFTMNANAAGNAELQNIAIGNVNVEFSDTLNPFGGGANPRFVRVGVSAANFARPSWLLQTIGVANVSVGARAVAGPSPQLTCPTNMIPVAPCGTPGAANYGYTVGQEVQLKYDSNNKSPAGPGNFGNVDLGSCGPGKDCVRDGMAGLFTGCPSTGNIITTDPGNNVGPNAKGLNTRFDCPSNCNPVDTFVYKPDVIIRAYTKGDPYQQYMTDRANGSWDLQPPTAQYEPSRRIVSVPVIDCSGGNLNGKTSVNVLGIACMFLTQATTQKGNTQTVFAEFLSSGCIAEGSFPGPNPVTGPGPHTIILYKDFGVPDS